MCEIEDSKKSVGQLNTVSKTVDKGPSRVERLLMNMGVIGELMLLFAKGKRWWMAPLVLLLAVTGLLLVVLQSFEYVAPFIYVAF